MSSMAFVHVREPEESIQSQWLNPSMFFVVIFYLIIWAVLRPLFTPNFYAKTIKQCLLLEFIFWRECQNPVGDLSFPLFVYIFGFCHSPMNWFESILVPTNLHISKNISKCCVIVSHFSLAPEHTMHSTALFGHKNTQISEYFVYDVSSISFIFDTC